MKLDISQGNVINRLIWGVVIILVGLFAVRRVIKLIDDLKARQAEADLTAAILPAALTYPLSQYKIFADQIHASFNGSGTDENAIYQVFKKMETTSDTLQLIKSFGTRTAENSGGFMGFGEFSGNLAAHLSNELDTDERDEINRILGNKGITVNF